MNCQSLNGENSTFLHNDDPENLNKIALPENEEKFENFNLINANARSLNNKLGSLIETLEEYEVSVAILSET